MIEKPVCPVWTVCLVPIPKQGWYRCRAERRSMNLRHCIAATHQPLSLQQPQVLLSNCPVPHPKLLNQRARSANALLLLLLLVDWGVRGRWAWLGMHSVLCGLRRCRATLEWPSTGRRSPPQLLSCATVLLVGHRRYLLFYRVEGGWGGRFHQLKLR